MLVSLLVLHFPSKSSVLKAEKKIFQENKPNHNEQGHRDLEQPEGKGWMESEMAEGGQLRGDGYKLSSWW